MNAVARWIATGFYTGYAPVASGTVGTLPAVVFAPALASLAGIHTIAYLAALAAIIALSIWSANAVAGQVGLRDPSIVVVDEVAGYFVAVAFLPATAPVLVAAFFLFRLFDIVKPPPARQAEGLHGGLGIVADDLIAGLFANLALRAAALAGLPIF